MRRVLKALPLALAIAALIAFAAFAAGCGSSNSQARFVNAISDSSPLDIEFNGTKLFTDLQVNAASGSTYVSVPSGNDTIAGFATGSTSNGAFTTNATLNSGSQYTLVATGLIAGSVTILNPVDQLTEPANGSVNFRVINASQFGPLGDGAAVDIYILPEPIVGGLSSQNITISDLAYQGTSSYITLPFNPTTVSGFNYEMFVTVTGSTTPVFTFGLNAGSVSLGTIRTLILTDTTGGEMSDQPIVLSDLN